MKKLIAIARVRFYPVDRFSVSSLKNGRAGRGDGGATLQAPVCPSGREKEEVDIEFLRCSRALPKPLGARASSEIRVAAPLFR